MEEEEDMLPPFWLQTSQADRRRRLSLQRSYSFFLSSGALVIFLLVTALVFIFIIIPTLLSFTSHIFKPHLVKKSWDSLNLVLVLFAIVCGFLSRNCNEPPRSYEDRSFSSNTPSQEYEKSNPTTPRSWYEYSDRTNNNSCNRLRSFNSYPDLRQESSWVDADERWRFYDDTLVSIYRGLDSDEHRQLRRWRPRRVDEEEEFKNIAMDTFLVHTKEAPSAPPIPEPHPPSSRPSSQSSPPPATAMKSARRNAKRTYQAIGPAEKTENQEIKDLEVDNFQPPRPTLSPPRPPVFLPTEKKTGQNKKKSGSATKEFLTSLRGKKKKQRQRSVENFESILNSEPFPPSSQPPLAPAPPPPPPLPPSVFHNLFSSKKSKQKKLHPAPPPPPPSSPLLISSMRVSKTKPRIGGATTNKLRISNKRENFNKLEDNVVIGNESPLIPIPPPPPPPPPFKMPAWKFRVQGDFVRIDSISSSRSGSPDLDEGVDSPTSQSSQCNSPSAPDGGEPTTTMPLFCPSPDVDTKADSFIERFRAGLRLEKMNSMKEKQGIGKSNLGPSNASLNTKEKIGLY